MKVCFDAAVLAQPERHGHDLNAMVERCVSGQHRWHIDDLDALRASPWMQGKARWDSQSLFAEKSFTDSIYQTAASSAHRTLLVVVAQKGSTAAAAAHHREEEPAQARSILEQPAYVVLENATSDWAFLRAVASAFDRADLWYAMEHHWLCPEQAGGAGEIAKRVDALQKRPVAAWRIAVVMDSDRLVPGPLPDKVDKLKKELLARGVTVQVLFKREIENYLPYSQLDLSDRHDTYVSFLTLTRIQQDHYDMKRGFSLGDGGKVVLPKEQQGLFEGVSDWHRQRLVRGFGSRIGECFAEPVLDRAELDEVCSTNPQELETILDALEEIL